jgi:hypothetical protein
VVVSPDPPRAEKRCDDASRQKQDDKSMVDWGTLLNTDDTGLFAVASKQCDNKQEKHHASDVQLFQCEVRAFALVNPLKIL